MWVHRGSTDYLILLQISSGVVRQTKDLHLSCSTLNLFSPRLCFFIVINLDLFVDREDSLTSKRIVMRTKQPTNVYTTSDTEGEVGPVKLI